MPSMKAALEAWGSDPNLFHKGFAKETADPAIVAAAMKHPGVVLKRPVGSKGLFKPHAELPSANFLAKKPVKPTKENRIPTNKSSQRENPKVLKREFKVLKAFEQEKKRKDKQRQKEEARKKLAEKKCNDAITRAQQALNESQAQHERKIMALKEKQAAMNVKIAAEEANWRTERIRLELAIEKLKE